MYRKFFSVSGLFLLLGACLVPMACDFRTHEPWAGYVTVARPEHPRPDFLRRTFVNLNTHWDFAYDPGRTGEAEGRPAGKGVWDDKIQLPYAWESPLSGLVPPHEGPYTYLEALTDGQYRGVAWYRLKLPRALDLHETEDWWLVIGASDFATSVFVNGSLAVTHEGGYAPVEANLSPFLKEGEAPVIVVRVEDLTEDSGRVQPVGKQGSTWYTRTSGIWQTVYLELRPALYLTDYRVVWDGKQATLKVTLSGKEDASLDARFWQKGGALLQVSTKVTGGVGEVVLPLHDPQEWMPLDPNLYILDLSISTGASDDWVTGYFGLVSWGTDWMPGRTPAETTVPTDQYKVLTANGEPVFLRCVLDQSYWPDGIYTAPSVAAIKADLQRAKDFGFNCIRLHIKTDEPVKYMLAAQAGLMVVYDIPSLDIPVRNVPGFKGRDYFASGLREAVLRDRHHPAIAAWVVFNENWGLSTRGQPAAIDPFGDNPELQGWINKMVDLTRSLDPYRPVEDNSAGGLVGVYEHIGNTDFNSFHFYGDDSGLWRAELAKEAALTFPGSTANFVGGARQSGQVWWNSEFASFSTVGGVPGSKVYCDLFAILNEMRRVPKLTGFVLTELTDVEFELNGLVNYDRSPKDDLCARNGVALKDVLGDDFVAFDWLPGQAVSAATDLRIPLQIAWWGVTEPTRLELSWWQDEEPLGQPVLVPLSGARRWHNLALEPELLSPAAGNYDLVVRLLDPASNLLAANRMALVVE